MRNFLDFITGGFFNYIGAIVRLSFSKEKFATLVEENQSNNYGMLVTTILLFAVFIYIKYF
jgi:hypothetical protein